MSMIHLSSESARRLRAHLKKGGLVAYPTESCYGLGCLPQHTGALRKIIQLKKRPMDKGLIVIAQSLTQLKPLLKPLSQQTINTLNQTWPAAKTFIIPAKNKVSPLLRGRHRNTLAVRIPGHKGARHLSYLLGTALVSTSANKKGLMPCRSYRETTRQFGRKVWVIKGQIGRSRKPSQIIHLETGKTLRS